MSISLTVIRPDDNGDSWRDDDDPELAEQMDDDYFGEYGRDDMHDLWSDI